MSVPARIEAALAAARAARAREDLPAARGLLDDVSPHAEELDLDHPLRHRLAWRRAKVLFDLGDAPGAVALLEPIAHAPFAHYPSGLDACATLAQAVWSQAGYGLPALRGLLEAAHRAHEGAGDPYRALQSLVWRSWDLACAGDLDELQGVLEHFVHLHPDDLAGGPTRHSRATDAATSVPWLQQDLARTALRACTWAREPHLVDAAEDLLETSADDAGLDREREYWFVEPIAMARIRLGRPDPDDYAGAWVTLAPGLKHPRAGYHRALARASTDPGRAPVELPHAAREAVQGDYGPEWEIDPLLELGRITGTVPPEALARIESHRVLVFGQSRPVTSIT